MRQTLRLLQKGFFRRSLDELKWQSSNVFNMSNITGKFPPLEIVSFRNPSLHKTTTTIKLLSDADTGGKTSVSLNYVPLSLPGAAGFNGSGERRGNNTTTNPSSIHPSTTTPTPLHHPQPPNPHYARLSGVISLALPRTNPQIQQAGYAAFRTLAPERNLFGEKFWNVEPYRYLALRIKSDGSKYLVNIQTDSIEPTDLHQHRLFARKKGSWEVVYIEWSEFVRTSFGRIVEPQEEMMKTKVKTVGIGLSDRVPGPFELCIDRIWCTDVIGDEDDGFMGE